MASSLLALRRTQTANIQSASSRDTGKREPMLSRGGTDNEGRPTGKIVGERDQSNMKERGF